MHIYAIGDLHLSGEPASKPMEVFGEHWRNHKEKVAANWQNTVTAQDTVIVCGDISWAMTLEEAAQDLDWLAHLPGCSWSMRWTICTPSPPCRGARSCCAATMITGGAA